MKRLLLFLFICPLFAFSQSLVDSIPFDSSQYARYEGIIEQTGTKDELYNKAKIWFADFFKDANSVIQTDDKDAGTLTGKGAKRYSYLYVSENKKKRETGLLDNGRAQFTIKIFLKDNKYKYVISDITYKDEFMSILGNREVSKIYVDIAEKNNNKANLNEYRAIHEAMLTIIEDLKNKMAAKAENSF